MIGCLKFSRDGQKRRSHVGQVLKSCPGFSRGMAAVTYGIVAKGTVSMSLMVERFLLRLAVMAVHASRQSFETCCVGEPTTGHCASAACLPFHVYLLEEKGFNREGTSRRIGHRLGTNGGIPERRNGSVAVVPAGANGRQ